MPQFTRRQVVQNIFRLGGLSATVMGGGRLMGATCGTTPKQTEGPFHPENNPLNDHNNDLTLVAGATAKPMGQVIYVAGVIRDVACRPIPNALIEVWQACASGRYNHSLDNSGLDLDANFGYWGETRTDSQGRYAFKSIIPGHYPASADWIRPPHIHVKVVALRFRELITQMYFREESFADPALAKLVGDLNREDKILAAVPNSERVLVAFQETPAGTEIPFTTLVTRGNRVERRDKKFVTEKGERLGQFDVVLQAV